jgi:cytochrome oxidase Cu insertion factor (SCO1/SenC/PrrC family)
MLFTKSFLTLAIGAGMVAGAAAQTKKASTAEAKLATGPEVGQKIPPFEALDQNGKRQTFESLKGPNGLLLMIHRSADW